MLEVSFILGFYYSLVDWHLVTNWAGGTFALYSLLCQHAKISQRLGDPSYFPVDESSSSLKLEGTKSRCSVVSNRLRSFLENRKGVQFWLFFVVMFGTCLVIGDGILTPAISGAKPCYHLHQFLGNFLIQSFYWSSWRCKNTSFWLCQCNLGVQFYQPWQEFKARIQQLIPVSSKWGCQSKINKFMNCVKQGVASNLFCHFFLILRKDRMADYCRSPCLTHSVLGVCWGSTVQVFRV